MKRLLRSILAISLVLQILLFSVSPISAEGNFSEFQFILREDNYGIIFLSKGRLRILPLIDGAWSADVEPDRFIYHSLGISYAFENATNNPLIILVPSAQTSIGTTYDIYAINQSDSKPRLYTYNISTGDFVIDFVDENLPISGKYGLFGTINSYDASVTPFRFWYNRYPQDLSSMTLDGFVDKFHFTANYDPVYAYSGYPIVGYRFPAENVTVKGSVSNTNIYDFLEMSDVSSEQASQIVNVINNVINAGAGNTVPSGGDELAKVEDKLSDAEQKLEDKSVSLADSVKSEWTANISDTKVFAQSLTTTATEINNLYTTVMTAVPNEIKAVFVSIPLLLFIGWVIGRKD